MFQSTVAKAIVLDLLTCALPAALKGLTTEVIPGSFATLASIAVTSEATPGESNVPLLASSTISSDSPDAAGKLVFKMLSARAESVFGSWNWLEYVGLAATSAARNAMTATSHSVRTSLRCRKHHLARAGIWLHAPHARCG